MTDTSVTEWLRRQLVEDDILRDSVLLTTATVLAGGLNYVYQVYMGRALGPEEYGVFGAVFAIQYLLHILGRSVRFTSIRFVAASRDDPKKAQTMIRGLLYRSGGVSVVVAVLLVGTTPLLADFLKLSDGTVVLAVAAYALFGLAHTASQGVLQALEAFTAVGLYQVGNAALKLGIAVVLVTLGFGAFGAILAIGVAALLVLVVTLRWLTRHYDSARFLAPRQHADARFDRERVYRYSVPALLTGFCLTVPTTVDVLIIKHFFTAAETGVFTAVTVLGKVLIFFPLGITRALFPKVSHSDAADVDNLPHLFDRALLYTALVTGGAVATYWLAPGFVLGVLFGSAYDGGTHLLRWYGIAIAAFVVAIVPLNYELALNNMRYVYLFTVLTVAEIVLMWTFHSAIVHVTWVILAVNAVLCGIGVVTIKYRHTTT